MIPFDHASLDTGISDAGSGTSATARPEPAALRRPRVGSAYGHPVGLSRPVPALPRPGPIRAPGAPTERIVLAALGPVADILDVSVEVCAALTTVAAHAVSAALRPNTASARPRRLEAERISAEPPGSIS